MFWRSLQHAFDDDFSEAVDHLIANHRAAPMLDDLCRACEEVRARRQHQQVRDGYASRAGLPGAIRDAEANNRTADPDYVKACVQLLQDKWTGKLTRKQFSEGCTYLDEVGRQLSK